jgi:hypothetical protein
VILRSVLSGTFRCKFGELKRIPYPFRIGRDGSRLRCAAGGQRHEGTRARHIAERKPAWASMDS